jgi:hypothetical protein
LVEEFKILFEETKMIGILIATVLVSTPLVPPQVKDAQSLSDYMRAEFTYKAEPRGEDYWQSAEETAKLKTYDCEDASFYSEKVLTQLGYEAYSIAIYGKQEGKKYFHAVCILKMSNGKWRYMSNGYYSYFRDFETITDIINFECPLWNWWGYIYLPHEIKDRHFQTN